jgi:hypothetical protein
MVGRAFVTVYMTRGQKMTRHPVHNYRPDFKVLTRLAESVAPYGELIVVTDSLTPKHVPSHLRGSVTIRRVAPLRDNFFMARWDAIRDTLHTRPDLELVYAVDGRDVVVVKDPWDYIQAGILYTCTEPSHLIVGRGRRWLGQPLGRSGFINDIGYHPSPVVRTWIRRHRGLVALNAGVVAADRATMLKFATRMAEARLEDHMREDYTDMGLFNWVAHSEFQTVGSEEFIGSKCHLEADAPKARVLHVP